MSDERVREALRSEASLVLVEAPAGCGKTHHGAEYAREAGRDLRDGRVLVLTHTHAARSVFCDRTRGCGQNVEARTIDSLITEIATAYHKGLDLPPEPGTWARQRTNGYAEVAARVGQLLDCHPMIAGSLARRYPRVVCDEHQDSSGDQHAVVMAMYRHGAKARIFADPMQRIFRETKVSGGKPGWEWDALAREAERTERLGHPHRWSNGCKDLGAWTLEARAKLGKGQQIDLRSGVPGSVSVVRAENEAARRGGYMLSRQRRPEIDAFVNEQASLLVLARHNMKTKALRAFFGRRLPLWEGHTRGALEQLADATVAAAGRPDAVAEAVVRFMGDVGTGFSRTAFGNALVTEAKQGCTRARRGKPAKIQELARLLVAEPDHRGVAKLLRRLCQLRTSDDDFRDIQLDGRREFFEAAGLDAFDDCQEGLLEIARRRAHAPQRMPRRAISTIHKAKGLEYGAACLMDCDDRSFPDSREARCVLYVALSRAASRLQLVVSEHNPSPLLRL